jgi:hypothetical protein
MVVRGVYTKAEQKMLAEWKERSNSLVGWLGETPSEEVPYPIFHRTASPDLIMHMAYAVDYRNPLWRDESYARNTRWGGVIAPPFFLACITNGGPFYWINVTPEVGIFAGMIIGEYWEFFKPIHVNDSFKVWIGPPAIIDVTRPGNAAERRFRINTEVSYINQRDEIVGILRRTDYNTILPPGAEIGEVFRPGTEISIELNLGIKPSDFPGLQQTREYVYTREEIKAIDHIYEAEERQGAKIRYWEDVRVGDVLPPAVIGPITVWDQVVEIQGSGAALLPMMEVRRQTPDRVMIDPASNIPHKSIEIHLSEKAPPILGLYSTTVIQGTIEHLLGRLITNWMGDDGFLRKFNWLKLCNTAIGDTAFGRGKVVNKYIDRNGEHLVDLDVWMETNRGYVSNVGPATVSLLSREKGFTESLQIKGND